MEWYHWVIIAWLSSGSLAMIIELIEEYLNYKPITIGRLILVPIVSILGVIALLHVITETSLLNVKVFERKKIIE